MAVSCSASRSQGQCQPAGSSHRCQAVTRDTSILDCTTSREHTRILRWCKGHRGPCRTQAQGTWRTLQNPGQALCWHQAEAVTCVSAVGGCTTTLGNAALNPTYPPPANLNPKTPHLHVGDQVAEAQPGRLAGVGAHSRQRRRGIAVRAVVEQAAQEAVHLRPRQLAGCQSTRVTWRRVSRGSRVTRLWTTIAGTIDQRPSSLGKPACGSLMSRKDREHSS